MKLNKTLKAQALQDEYLRKGITISFEEAVEIRKKMKELKKLFPDQPKIVRQRTARIHIMSQRKKPALENT